MTSEASQLPTLWLDVQTLLHMTGRPTGIPRTLLSLLQVWVQKPELPIRFCQYFSLTNSFVLVPKEHVLQCLAKHLGSSAESAASAASAAPLPAVAATNPPTKRVPREPVHPMFGLRDLAECGMNALRSCKCFLHMSLHLPLAWARIVGARSAKKVLAKFSSHYAVKRGCHFTPGDVLLLVGVSWHHPLYCQVVRKLQETQGLKFAAFLYDVIAHAQPHLFDDKLQYLFETWASEILRTNDLVFTISQHSQRDIRAWQQELNAPEKPIEVIRLGDDLPTVSAQPPEKLRGWLGPNETFVLSVGTIEVRKNHLLLYQAWRRLVQKHGNRVPKLVLAGGKGWLTSDLRAQLERDPAICEHIRVVENALDAELRWLYSNCRFTLYPSQYEGWGLPVAESLLLGKYCIASAATSIPEIAGPLLDYHAPDDLASCVQLIERALFDDAYLAEREARIRAEYQPTSWESCAMQVIGFIEKHFGPICAKSAHAEPAEVGVKAA